DRIAPRRGAGAGASPACQLRRGRAHRYGVIAGCGHMTLLGRPGRGPHPSPDVVPSRVAVTAFDHDRSRHPALCARAGHHPTCGLSRGPARQAVQPGRVDLRTHLGRGRGRRGRGRNPERHRPRDLHRALPHPHHPAVRRPGGRGTRPAQETRTPAGQRPPARPAEAEWRRIRAPLLGGQTRPDAVPLAIGVELLPVRRWHGYSHLAAEHAAPADLGSGVPLTVVLRPLRAGKRENWIKGGLSWNRFLYSSAGSEFVPEQARWLTRLVRLHRAGQPFASDPGERLRLDELTSAEGWALLRDLDRAGIPLVGAGSVEAVTWGPPAHARLDV